MSKPLIYSALAGCTAVLIYYTYKSTVGSEAAQTSKSMESIIKKIIQEMKAELRKNFNFDPPREEGLLAKEWFI